MDTCARAHKHTQTDTPLHTPPLTADLGCISESGHSLIGLTHDRHVGDVTIDVINHGNIHWDSPRSDLTSGWE